MKGLTLVLAWYVDHMAVLGEKITWLLAAPIRWASDRLMRATHHGPVASPGHADRPE